MSNMNFEFLNKIDWINKDKKTFCTIEDSEGVKHNILHIERKENYGYIYINDDIIEKIDRNLVKIAIQEACFLLSSREWISPIVVSNIVDKQLEVVDSSTLISNIPPIMFDGSINLDEISTINECIEPPLRKACMLLNEKGIKTIMSSCNSNDVKNRNTKIDKYQVPPFFIGNGYAWIMLDWESLTEENKKKLIEYNSGKKQFSLSQKEQKLLIHNCTLDNSKIPINWQMVRFFEVINAYEYFTNRNAVGKLEKKSEQDEYFDLNRSGMLSKSSLNNISSDFRVAVVRYPIDELTTIGEVERFFDDFVLQLSNQSEQNQSHKKESAFNEAPGDSDR